MNLFLRLKIHLPLLLILPFFITGFTNYDTEPWERPFYNNHLIFDEKEYYRLVSVFLISEYKFIHMICCIFLYLMMRRIESVYYSPYNHFSFIKLYFFSIVSAIITGIFDEAPSLGIRVFIFYAFLYCKVCSHDDLGFNSILFDFSLLIVPPVSLCVCYFQSYFIAMAILYALVSLYYMLYFLVPDYFEYYPIHAHLKLDSLGEYIFASYD